MSPFLLILLPALLLALLGLLAVFGSLRRARSRRPLAALTQGTVGVCLLLLALLFGGLAATIVHYQRLTGEQSVATLSLRQLGPQRFAARLDRADGQHRSFELFGDQWQIDARVLRWRLPALLAGAPNLYRLERLSGRYQDIDDERQAPRSLHDLADDGYPDLWALKRQFPQWLGFVDAEFGSATYLPMLDGAHYTVTLGPRGGLVARPADDQTERLLRAAGW